MTYAIFHVVQPDGSVVATSESHPSFAIISNNVRDSKRRSEEALREHLQRIMSFAHYEVPAANDDLQSAA